MTTEELLQALQESRQMGSGEGFTVQEVCVAAGMGPEKARRLIRGLLAEGRMRVTRKPITAMDGRTIVVPSYVLVR